MVTDIWDRASSLFERRFLTNALLPVGLFLPAVTTSILVGSGQTAVLVDAVESLSVASGLVLTLTYFLAIWFIGAFVQSQWRNIIRIYEGYPLRSVPIVGKWGQGYHLRRLRLIQSSGDTRDQYYHYPSDPEDLLPTRLGNTLRAAERYGRDRYNMDTILAWPRLVALLPKSFAAQVDEFRGSVEFLLVVSIWCVAYALVTGPSLLVLGADALVFAGVMLVPAILAYLSYKGAISAAVEYGEQMKVGQDLYRQRIFTQMRLPIPDELELERSQWEALGEFVLSNYVDDLHYTPGEPPPPAD